MEAADDTNRPIFQAKGLNEKSASIHILPDSIYWIFYLRHSGRNWLVNQCELRARVRHFGRDFQHCVGLEKGGLMVQFYYGWRSIYLKIFYLRDLYSWRRDTDRVVVKASRKVHVRWGFSYRKIAHVRPDFVVVSPISIWKFTLLLTVALGYLYHPSRDAQRFFGLD